MNIEKLPPKQCLQAYLCCSYMYYIELESLVSDNVYDALGKKLLNTIPEWSSHQHAHLVTEGDLKAGTLYTLKADDYPEMVKQAATIWARESFK